MDRSIAQAAQAIFRASSHPPLRRVSCEFCDGVLTLRGRVSSFHLKQLAQSAVLGLDSVTQVDNRIEVQ